MGIILGAPEVGAKVQARGAFGPSLESNNRAKPTPRQGAACSGRKQTN